jgi:hypothetical protein
MKCSIWGISEGKTIVPFFGCQLDAEDFFSVMGTFAICTTNKTMSSFVVFIGQYFK